MSRDARSYQLSHTWDEVISRSRATSSCKQSRRDQDVRRTSEVRTLSIIRLLTYFQLCKVCFYVIRLLTAHCPKQQPIFFTKILGKHRHGLLNVSENDKCKCNCTLKGLNDDDQQQNVGLPSKSATPRCSCIDDFCSFRPIIHVICM